MKFSDAIHIDTKKLTDFLHRELIGIVEPQHPPLRPWQPVEECFVEALQEPSPICLIESV